MGGGTQGCRKAPGDLPGGGGTTRVGFAPGSPTEAQQVPARAESCWFCFCSLLAPGKPLVWGNRWTPQPTSHQGWGISSPRGMEPRSSPPSTCSLGPW